MEAISDVRCIAMLVPDGSSIVGVAGPAEVFTVANALLARAGRPPAYQVSCVSRRGGWVGTSSGFALQTQPLEAVPASTIDTLLVCGGPEIGPALRDAVLIDWIGQAAPKAARVGSIGTGSFLLAAAGLLNGQRAVTLAGHGDDFRARFPRVQLDDDPIYVQSGKFWTSAGMTAGIDMALALVRADLGPQIGLDVARTLVVFMARSGSQAQRSTLLNLQERLAQRGTDSMLTDLLGWVATRLSQPTTVTDMAGRAGMSPRNFARFFVRSTGQTPAKVVEQLRVERACHLLESSPVSIKAIAAQSGFVDDERMRRAFVRQLGCTPAEYRTRLGGVDVRGRKASSGQRHVRRAPLPQHEIRPQGEPA
jgi:transcriptional regulator GlxA family with amidase domain